MAKGRIGTIAIFAISLIACSFFRIYQLDQIPFMNDELSALSRANFNSFSELIEYGIQVEGHPAFLQTLLWYWSDYANSEFAIRLPFVLLGIGATVFYTYIAYSAFGKYTAVLSSLVIASSQVIILDSVIARPYPPGLFFTAGTAFFWYRRFYQNSTGLVNIFGLSIFLSLSFYTHYFAGLTSAIIFLSGFSKLKKENWKGYVVAGILAFILFLPHLKIFITQISHKGIGGPDGWLGEPQLSYLYKWVLTSLNWSYWAFVLIILGLAMLIVRWKKAKSFQLQFALFFLGWYVAVFSVGYVYSIIVNPVIHIQTLVFPIPFLLIAAIGGLVNSKVRIIQIAAVSIPIIVAFNLFEKREHYKNMAAQPFEWIAKQSAENPSYLVFTDHYLEYIEIQAKYSGYPFLPSNYIQSELRREKIKRLDESNTGLISDGKDQTLVFAASLKYPHIQKRYNGFTFTGYTFKNGDNNSSEYYEPLANGKINGSFSSEFYNLTSIPLREQGINFGHSIRVIVEYKEDVSSDLILVADFQDSGNTVEWIGSDFNTHSFAFGNSKFQVLHINLWDRFENNSELENIQAKIYLWNVKKETVYPIAYTVQLENVNPNYYGLFLQRPEVD